MLALKMRKSGTKVKILGASEVLVKLLQDLGVAKLFDFVSEKGTASGEGQVLVASGAADMLATAETVAEAHRTLAEADSSNAERFKQVIEFADQDVQRLKKQSE